MMPIFDRPYLLALAVLLPAIIAVVVVASYRRRQARLARLASHDMLARLIPRSALEKPVWRGLRLGTVAALCGIAIAGPRWGTEQDVVRGSGIDVVLALDASLSMLARDEQPSRLERMKIEVRRLRAMSGTDRVGLLAFAGRSYVLTPLTIDAGALDLYLDNLDPSIVGQPGTSLSATIRQGLALLQTGEPATTDRALVIMTDGEAHEPVEDIVAAARPAREAGIAVVAVGFGTTTGTTIPLKQDSGTETLKRDQQGQIVVTQYRPDVLRALTDAAGGTFIEASETDKAGRVRQALSTLRAAQRTALAGREQTPRFQLFLVPALFLFALDTVLVERVGRRRQIMAASATSTELAA
jgi:Ca-activated chloride channel family protein